jgi:hypothetical protein
MTKNNSGSAQSRSGSNRVPASRLTQRSGAQNSFGGYTKVSYSNGTFSMRKTTK